MRLLLLTFCLLLFSHTYAGVNANNLQVERDGLTVVVLDFKEGDKIKLFEVETGDHILSKTRGQIDLSQLPNGKYLLENNEGQSIVIEKKETDIVIDEELGTDYIVENDSESMPVGTNVDVEDELGNYYVSSELNPLYINREGDIITVMDFEEGDKIKLFEVIDRVHILSKTTKVVDLTQLAAGKYILENDRGQSVIIEKFQVVEQDQFAVAYN